MNIIYWNVNSGVPLEKTKWIDDLILEHSPDILCIAEGPESIEACTDFVTHINGKGHKSYYNPTLFDGDSIGGQFGWNRFGLKVFIKKGFKLLTKFAFGNQNSEGRIVYLRVADNSSFYSIFLIHGVSKSGDEIKQAQFMAILFQFIKAKSFDKKDERIIVLGDFNLEPWDDLLRSEKYIFSHFYRKSFLYHSHKKVDFISFNPVLEYLQQQDDAELVGTFYNEKFLSILDFPLLSENLSNFNFEILTEVNKARLLRVKKTRQTLVDGFDHLPIHLKIT